MSSFVPLVGLLAAIAALAYGLYLAVKKSRENAQEAAREAIQRDGAEYASSNIASQRDTGEAVDIDDLADRMRRQWHNSHGKE